MLTACLHNFPPTKFGVCENCWSTLYQNQIFETIHFTVVSSGPAKPGIPADRQNRPQSCNVYCCRIITTGVNLIHCPYCPVATLRSPVLNEDSANVHSIGFHERKNFLWQWSCQPHDISHVACDTCMCGARVSQPSHWQSYDHQLDDLEHTHHTQIIFLQPQ